jgi:CDP-6-deoxy-D-xylo-4-hexulose-3-dehydrase
MKQIDLIQDTIDNQDIDNLIEWLKTYPRLTKGSKTIEFENKWSKWLGSKYSVFVNSGSSANLLMLYALKVLNKMKNNKVCVPSLCWATDLAPVLQFDMKPLLIDCNLDNLSVDLNHLEEVFKTEQPSVLLLVSVLGLSPDMESIVELCEKYDVILLEDNCESQGTKFKGTKLGNFGLMSSFSTYFGHTMSTIEGGVISSKL